MNNYQEYVVRVFSDRTEWYNQNNQLHREDGPAVEFADGSKSWYKNGQRHREDGPACEHDNGTNYWYKNGFLHREDGPAIEYTHGHKEWWVEGQEYTEQEFNNRRNKQPCCITDIVIEIKDKKYKLIKI